MSQRLDEIAEALIDNYKRDYTSSIGFMWCRACLYAEARKQFKSDKLFGQWRQSLSTDVGRVDPVNTVSKLIKCHKYLDGDTFIGLGHSLAFEFMIESLWKKHREETEELIKQLLVERKPVKVVRSLVAEIQGKASKEKPDWYVDPKSKMFSLIRLSIVNMEYIYSDSEFFHPQPEIRRLQMAEVETGSKYAFMLFGIDLKDKITPDMVVKAYKRLALKYHPDRPNGSDEMMVLINRVREHLMRVCSYVGTRKP